MSAWNSTVRVQYRPILAEKGQAQSAGKLHAKANQGVIETDHRPSSLAGLICRKQASNSPNPDINGNTDWQTECEPRVPTAPARQSQVMVNTGPMATTEIKEDTLPRRAFTVRLPKVLASHLAKRAFAENTTYQAIIQKSVQMHLDQIEDDIRSQQVGSKAYHATPLLTPHRRRIQKLFL